MSYRIFLLLIISSLCFHVQSQNIGAKADSLYGAKNYKAAAPMYVWAASLNEFRSNKASSYYNAACSYALTGNKDSAFIYLKKATELGWNNKTHLQKDTDLDILHGDKQWKKIVKSIKEPKNWSGDPLKARLVTSDITNFWEAYDLAQNDTAHRLVIYRKSYIEPGSPGLHDYFGMKVGDMRSFVREHDKKSKFYHAIRANTLQIETQKPQMIAGFVKFKELYADARFPSIYFVIGNWTSGGTASGNGLLIGADQYVKSPDIPLDELSMWEKNNFGEIENLPHIIAHELIHFNQNNLSQDTSLLSASLREGMCDFFAELMTGKTANNRLHVWAKGKEKTIWEDFKKEMWLNRASNWIANARQETADRPADLGYWMGYMISKAYYNNASDKKQAVYDILHIKDYKAFYEKSKIEEMINSI
jgi:tetratricopeptide (TPR) repeat protein